MASLREVVSQYKEELRDGIAWLVFWKEGRSWKAEYFYLEPSEDTLLPEDKEMLEKVQKIDPAAVVFNGYYCGYLAEDMSIAELASGVRCHYENGYNKIINFIRSHKFSLLEKRAEIAKEARKHEESEKGRMIHLQVLNAYKKALRDYHANVKEQIQPLSVS